jgi:chromosome segregation ATPase
MARRATEMRTSTPKGRRPAKVPTAPAKPTAKTTAPKKAAAAKRQATPAAGFTSKEELRAQVEKLERANATLRTKSREAGRAAKLAADRIAELEGEVARLERRLASQAAAAKRARQPAAASERRTPRREIDPGDAVPPGVAPQEPIPPDAEAEQARENLEEHLGHEQGAEPANEASTPAIK